MPRTWKAERRHSDGVRFMCWHVERFKAVPTEGGRSSLLEDGKPVESGEALLIFVSFEKADEPRMVDVVDRAVNEIQAIAAQLGVYSVVLNPFAHMFGELSSPSAAAKMLDMLSERLADRKFSVQRLAFGRFYEMELKAKGHKLARISRAI